MIWNPNELVKIFVGTMSYNLFNAAKSTMTTIASGMTHEALKESIRVKYNSVEDPVMISIDGGAHDSSMRRWLINAVDNEVLKALGTITCAKS